MKFGWVLLGTLSFCLFVMLWPSSSWARPRDEVMSRAFRCAVISDSRLWLDCYYGAAQPQRAALGLQPAPPLQLKLVLAPPMGNASPSDTATRNQVLSGAFGCSQLGDDHRWLDCYYAAAQPMRVILGLSPAPQAPLLNQGPVAPTNSNSAIRSSALQNNAMPSQEGIAAANFGLPAKIQGPTAGHIDTTMVKYTFDRYGIFTATLANGQVWRQISGDTSYAHWNKPAQTYQVRISHGFLGSFNFQVKHNPGLFKVIRVQ